MSELPAEQAAEKNHTRLLQTMDALEWAKEFVRLLEAGTFKEGVNVDLMVTWFAGSIMTGYDHGGQHAEARLFGTKEEPRTLEALRGQAIDHALRLYDGNKSKAADHLNIDRRTLYRQVGKRTPQETGEGGSESCKPGTQ